MATQVLRSQWVRVIVVLLALIAVAQVLVTNFFVAEPSGTGLIQTSITIAGSVDSAWERSFDWQLSAATSQSNLDLFAGDTHDVAYTVNVVPGNLVDVYTAFGSITISNACSKTDVKTAFVEYVNITPQAYIDGSWTSLGHSQPVHGPVIIDTCAEELIEFDLPVMRHPAADGYRYLVGVGLSNAEDGKRPRFKEITDTLAFSLPERPSMRIMAAVAVDSTQGEVGLAAPGDGAKTFTYNQQFTCDNEGLNESIITLKGSDFQVSLPVTVNCYDLDVQLDTGAVYVQSYDWLIQKWATNPSGGELVTQGLTVGQAVPVNYTVYVDVASARAGSYALSGTLTVANTSPVDVTLASAENMYYPTGGDPFALTLRCDGVSGWPHVLASGETLTCTFATGLSGLLEGVSRAVVVLQNTAYDVSGAKLPPQDGDDNQHVIELEQDVSFEGAASVVDGCVQVTDDTANISLGLVCADDAPKAFLLSGVIGPYNICGDYQVSNTASYASTDGSEQGTASWLASVGVVCPVTPEPGGGTDPTPSPTPEPGGMLACTPGFWSTHSAYGPAAPDMWTPIGFNPDSPVGSLFSAASTYGLQDAALLEALGWPGGNSVTQTARLLIHHSIAAVLNEASFGADYPAASVGEIQANVNAALNSGSKAQMEALKDLYDGWNNTGTCPDPNPEEEPPPSGPGIIP